MLLLLAIYAAVAGGPISTENRRTSAVNPKRQVVLFGNRSRGLSFQKGHALETITKRVEHPLLSLTAEDPSLTAEAVARITAPPPAQRPEWTGEGPIVGLMVMQQVDSLQFIIFLPLTTFLHGNITSYNVMTEYTPL